jgi:hypothetical protein
MSNGSARHLPSWLPNWLPLIKLVTERGKFNNLTTFVILGLENLTYSGVGAGDRPEVLSGVDSGEATGEVACTPPTMLISRNAPAFNSGARSKHVNPFRNQIALCGNGR